VQPSFQPRFGQAADAYVAFRSEYPPESFEQIVSGVPPVHRDRAMDLSAGAGKLTSVLLAHFTEVIALEPDALSRRRTTNIGAKPRRAPAPKKVPATHNSRSKGFADGRGHGHSLCSHDGSGLLA
jgi:hypothetical protein